jgi:ketosteroid isomerase-like protein
LPNLTEEFPVFSKQRSSILVLALIAVNHITTGSCQTIAGDTRRAIQQETEAQTIRMTQAFKRGDLAAVARFYSDDAQMISGGTEIRGRREIDRFWGKILHPSSLQMQTLEVGGSKDEPFQLVRSILVEQAGAHADTSLTTCLLIWRRGPDGQLRIFIDMFAHTPRDLADRSRRQ